MSDRELLAAQEALRESARLLERERAARAEAERAAERKDEFLAVLAHELRGPLGAILGWAQVIASRPMGREALERAVQVIERNARAQARLIEDALDVARIGSGQLGLEVRPVEPIAFVAAALEAARPAAGAKRIRLLDRLDGLAGPVSGDPGRLQQVVRNLLANAIKFTPEGGTVQVRLERVDSCVEIGVADSGRGIARQRLARIFERSGQGDRTSAQGHSGLGVGLAIASHLVELHGGTIGAESPGEGRGATFTVRLPLAARAAL